MRKLNQYLDKSLKKIFNKNYRKLLDEISQQIYDYHVSLNKPRFILGLSGGIDSAVVAFLINYSIGKENLITINLPYFLTDKGIKNTEKISKIIGNKHFNISIRDIVNLEVNIINSTLKTNLIKKKSFKFSEKIRFGNIASRIRVSIFYDFSKSYNGIVLGTGNKADYLLGYSTKWGTPISCDFAVLRDLYKYEIYKLGEILEIPKFLFNIVPTTGFFLGQTHESEIGMNLFKIDLLLFLLFEKKLNFNEIITNYKISEKELKSIMKIHELNSHKFCQNQDYVKIRS